MIHTATLLHDDVVDESKLRRGHATARIDHGNRNDRPVVRKYMGHPDLLAQNCFQGKGFWRRIFRFNGLCFFHFIFI